jgi:hypothetical protein
MSVFETNRCERHPDGKAAMFGPVQFAILLGIFILVLFPEVIFGSRTFVFRDFGLYGYPVAFYFRDAFWHGDVPLWNPLSNCGIPFIAEWSTLALYPFSLFYLVLPISWSLGVFCLGHLYLGGLGMYWLADRWTGDRLAATVAGVAFAFNGFMLSCLIWPHYMVSLAWMPLVLLTIPRAWAKGGRHIIYAVLAGSMQMLAGPPEVILATWGLLGGLWAGLLVFDKASPTRLVLRSIAIIMLITAVCAPQIFPFLDFLVHSQRDQTYGTGSWAMPGTGWANLVLPIFYQERTSAGVYMQTGQGIASSYYPGIGVLLFAGAAAWWKRKWWCRWFAFAAVACLVLALGQESFFYVVLRYVFPQIGFMRYPIKLVIPLTIMFPLLSAWALSALWRSDQITQNRRLKSVAKAAVALGGVLGFLLWFSWSFPVNEEPWFDTALNGAARALVLAATVLLLSFMNCSIMQKSRVLLGVSFVVLTWIDLITHVPNQNPTVETAAYEPGFQPILTLQPKPSLGNSRLMLSLGALRQMRERILTNAFEGYVCQRLAQFDNVNFYENTPKVDGFYSLYLRNEEQVRQALYVDTNSYLTTPLADFLSVSQITSPTNSFAFSPRTNFMRMTTAGQQPRYLDSASTLAAMMQTNWNPREVVLLQPDESELVSVTNRTAADIITSNWSAHRIAIDVQAQQPSLVVLSQSFYHPWTALVNGERKPILRANLAFQAVQVPKGRSAVLLVYQDNGFRLGMVLSMVALLSCGVALVTGCRPKMQKSRG